MGRDQGHGLLIIFYGRNGRIVLDPLKGVLSCSVRQEQYRELPTTQYNQPSVETELRVAAPSVVELSKRTLVSLLEQTNPPSAEQGRQAIEVLVAAHVSDENNHAPVELGTDALPEERVFPWA
jgi:hypothetical protein